MPAFVNTIKNVLKQRLEALEWEINDPIFAPDSVFLGHTPPPGRMILPAAQILDRGKRPDDEFPELQQIDIGITIYQTDYRDDTGDATIAGARGLSAVEQHIVSELAYVGRTYFPVRTLQVSSGVIRHDERWMAYLDLTFVCTGIAGADDDPAERPDIIYQPGVLEVDGQRIGEVRELWLNIREDENRFTAEDQGSAYAVSLEGAYHVECECELRGFVAAASDLFRTYGNTETGLHKSRHTIRFIPRDQSPQSLGWTLRNATAWRRRTRIRWSPSAEITQHVVFAADSADVVEGGGTSLLRIYRLEDE